VPEGYVRFLNEDEERQYLAQSPPSNTLLPRDQETSPFSSGEETPRPTTQISHEKAKWISSETNTDEGGWVDEPEVQAQSRDDWDVDGMITGVQKVNVQR